MNLWRQLRWRIIGGNMLVVVVGVCLVLLMANVLTRLVVPADVRRSLEAIAAAGDTAATQTAIEAVLGQFRRTILTAVAVAGLGALIAGILASLFLARSILRPLDELAASSERIAQGHYDERVAVPASDELARVATHFNQMAAALEQVEQQRINLIGNVSHELRTPLTGLAGYLEGMIDGLFPCDEETLARMYSEVRRLRRLVDDLQALSRVEAGQLALEIRPFDLRRVVQQTVQQVLPQAEGAALTLTVHLPPDPVLVAADPDRTAQILLNLLSNALRYTPKGGQVTVTVAGEGRQARVWVRDTGVGIPPESLPYLFERFYRVDRSRTRTSGGSGIGLTIARHLAWAMGGEITAESAGIHQGSTFTLTLPLSDAAPA